MIRVTICPGLPKAPPVSLSPIILVTAAPSTFQSVPTGHPVDEGQVCVHTEQI